MNLLKKRINEWVPRIFDPLPHAYSVPVTAVPVNRYSYPACKRKVPVQVILTSTHIIRKENCVRHIIRGIGLNEGTAVSGLGVSWVCLREAQNIKQSLEVTQLVTLKDDEAGKVHQVGFCEWCHSLASIAYPVWVRVLQSRRESNRNQGSGCACSRRQYGGQNRRVCVCVL